MVSLPGVALSQSIVQQPVTTDTLIQADTTILLHDSTLIYSSGLLLNWYSPVLSSVDKPLYYDIQQVRESNNQWFVFLMLIAALLGVTYVKMFFGKEISDLWSSITNPNIAQQIFRTQTRDLTLPSFVLHVNFLICISLLTVFFITNRAHVSATNQLSVISSITFLFTLFYLFKAGAIKILGVLFDLQNEASEYIYVFYTFSKTIGLAMLPALFVYHSIADKYQYIFWIVAFVVALLLLVFFVFRGLSTAYKLMYRSLYHFFIYVCVVEISPIFLLFKLLTKTIL